MPNTILAATVGDSTPIWFLAAVAAVLWTIALIVLWRAANHAPDFEGDGVKTDDDRWAEVAMRDAAFREIDR